MFSKKFPLVSLAAGFLTSFSSCFGASTEDVEISRDTFADVVTELLGRKKLKGIMSCGKITNHGFGNPVNL